ncbi:MAG TPA: 50S ribosomal protein L28 [Thermomicrobiaceae bacterium]|nr:50S ribosomal protein L28 [Thermomicrobiaceae bacterium]
MAKCEICGKGPGFGHNVSHSHHKTNRMFRPNIQRATIYKDGQAKKLNICTRCLRTLYKDARTA